MATDTTSGAGAGGQEGSADRVPSEDGAQTPAPERRPPVAPRLTGWWAVAAVFLVGLVFFATDHLLRGAVTISAGCVLGAFLRAVLPEAYAGGLVVRSRALDAVILLGLGVAVLVSILLVDFTPRT